MQMEKQQSDQGLHCLPRPTCPKTLCHYGITLYLPVSATDRITNANSLDPDQAQLISRSDLDLNCSTF